jgi:hypothetical protein
VPKKIVNKYSQQVLLLQTSGKMVEVKISGKEWFLGKHGEVVESEEEEDEEEEVEEEAERVEVENELFQG